MSNFVYKYQTVEPDGRYGWRVKQFKSQKELFWFLVHEKDEIFAQRKSIIKRAEGGLSFTLDSNPSELIVETKAFKPVYSNDKEAGTLKRTIIANTYWYMDSHSDVHIGREDETKNAIFSESIKDRAHKIFPMNQHDQSLDGKIGKSNDIFEAPISWRALGLGKTGMTEALFANAEIMQRKNQARYEDYLNDEIDQHSVGMIYLDQQIAVNDKDNYPKEYATYEKYIDRIGNRQKVEQQGYFFAVPKARLIEYSCVLSGSNDLTPTIQPSGDTGKSLPGGTPELKAVDMFKYYNPTKHI